MRRARASHLLFGLGTTLAAACASVRSRYCDRRDFFVHGALSPLRNALAAVSRLPFSPHDLSLATSAGECAEAILLLFPRRGRMCASCRQPRCGFCARMSLAILHLQRKIADRSTSSHLCEKAPSDSEDFPRQFGGNLSSFY